MNEKRKRMLIELENIIGNEFYNPHIQNYGPGGVYEGEGRSIRYGVTFRDKDGKQVKTGGIDPGISAETLRTGMYVFGANQLSIMRALDLMVAHLERNYGLEVGNAKK